MLVTLLKITNLANGFDGQGTRVASVHLSIGLAPVDIQSVYFDIFPTENGFTVKKEDIKAIKSKAVGTSASATVAES